MKKLIVSVLFAGAMCALADEPVSPAPAEGGQSERPEVMVRPERRDPAMRRPGMRGPRAKKCDCCENCKGVIILPPDSTEGEPLFKGRERMSRSPGEAGPGRHRGGPRRGPMKRVKPEQPAAAE